MSASRSLRHATLAIAINAAVATVALAQQTPVALDAVTVTADRRAENAKDVPVSATVLRPEYLDAISTSASDVRVLAGKSPSLNVESSNGRVFPRFYIRGYGNTDFTTYASQPVSLVYDDVVYENAFIKGFPMFDLASVEVLRGPQGTQFGRNTPGGVVKFNSVRPVLGETSGYASVSYGTHATSSVEGALNLPMGSDWAARISLLQQHRDDWVTSQISGQKLEGYDDTALRLQALFQPSEDFNALFNAHARKLNGTARLFRANIIQSGNNNLVDGFDEDKAYIDGHNAQELTTYGGSANLTFSSGDVTFHSITGYEGISKYYSRGDIDGGYGPGAFVDPAAPSGPGFIPFSVETAGGIKSLDQFTQELRAESNYAGPLNWQGGLYYFYDNVQGEAYDYDTIGGGALTGYDLTKQKTSSWAAFASLNYQATDVLNLRAGIRYTHDHKTFDILEWDRSSPPPIGGDTSGSKVTGDVAATWALSDAVNLYARAARGYRGASFGPPSTGVPVTVARPETVDSYELGIKADLWERRGRLAFDIYSMDIKDQQLTAVGGTSNAVQLINAKKSQAYGAELDFDLLLTENLRFGLNGSYNHTEIKDKDLATSTCSSWVCTVTDPVDANGFARIDGNPLPQAAKWIGNVNLRYGVPMGADGELFFYTDWSYRSEVNFFLYQSREFIGQPLTEGGLKIGYTWADGKYEASVFCRNCTNQIRATGAIDFDNLTGFINDPRIIGAQFRAGF
ncbi:MULTISPECIES: TonB-dependent receptor [Pseudoxanthomonas]|jgi:iron complex outermembrane receptor protein|uniref:TonB-dependent receptor n=1 Tax=Pseudoxanthomonas winnipegensis TaxID=2480810 RepID=A0A4Q8L5U9_9GAMM|nr:MULTISPECIES: TonB-dependent receptor [Pseudoxanthomonas]PZP58358.1 MAG: TonB-dependent receptor [Pseudoxanthomonas spadix]HCH0556775.1 TonB-dependent receptor [Pseudomonas aeruginosa]TAA21288.1 TonB-dependent receptor [Pseudoxanthomonas winnipegensis]TMN18948.1 TonB-dependent receptor [Pseudoxanthomonas sp. X-1]UAY74519.1 TonB-dependent receptor [Pseudoxanthomonas sp. X-1]